MWIRLIAGLIGSYALGVMSVWWIVIPMHKSLEKKYTRIISLLAEWQRKI